MVIVREYSTAYRLEPEGESVVVVWSFFNIRQRDNTRHRYNTSTFFLIFHICARYIWKNKMGLITKQAHVFLTNTSQYFYLPKCRSAAMTDVCLLRRELDTNLSQVSQVSECTIRTACQQTLKWKNGHFKSSSVSKACFSLLYNVFSY